MAEPVSADARRARAAPGGRGRTMRRFYGLTVDWAREVVVTSGATEAITACLMAVLNPGDEVVLIEPLYDTYAAGGPLLGAVPRSSAVAADWDLPRAGAGRRVRAATKAILLNIPMNPAGKVFTAEELALDRRTGARHDAYAICDEVYEHLIFDGCAPYPADDAARHARAHHADRQRGQDVLADRLEGRLRHGTGRAATVAKAHQNLTFTTRAQPAARGRRRLARTMRISPRCRARLQAKRDQPGGRAGRASGSTVLPTGALFHHCRLSAAGVQRR